MADETHATPHVNPWIIAVSVMFSTFMEVLDTTVVNVSLRHIAGSLSATVDEATWALTSYLVANAIILPLTGWLARVRLERRAAPTAAEIRAHMPALLPVLRHANDLPVAVDITARMEDHRDNGESLDRSRA